MVDLKDKQLKEAYNKSPHQIQEMVSSERVGVYAQIVGESYELSAENSIGVEDAINGVFLGLTHPKDFISKLQSLAGVDEKTARAMAKDINRAMFTPIKSLLMKMYDIKSPTEKEPGAKTSEPVNTLKTPEVKPKEENDTSIKQITSPKPTLVNPFKETKKAVIETPYKSEAIKKVIPPAPKPPTGYNSTENSVEETPIQSTTTQNPENPFEALLKKKSHLNQETQTPPIPKAETAKLTNLTEDTTSDIESAPVPNITVKETPPQPTKLHTTVAQAPKNPVEKESSHNKKDTPPVDPYREALT